MNNIQLSQSQIDLMASLISIIDNREKSAFLETVNTDRQVEAAILHNNDATGVFYSCLVNSELVIHLSFNTDTDVFNEKIAEHIQSAFKKSHKSSCIIWTAQRYRKSRMFLKDRFCIQHDSYGDYYAPGCNVYYYEAAEFMMHRESFCIKSTAKAGDLNLTIRPFEVQFLEIYLSLLNDVMAFDGLPPNFQGSKNHCLHPFDVRVKNSSFEAFWNDNELIGLYWRNDADIDIIAVARNQQGKGHGTAILTHVCNMIFENPKHNYARLYTLGWDTKTKRFFAQYGMEQTGHSYRLRVIRDIAVPI